VTDCRGFLFRSDDGGATWQTAYVSDVVPLALQFDADGTGWLAGGPASGSRSIYPIMNAEANLLETTDNGRSWQPLYAAKGGAFLSVSFPSATEGWLTIGSSVIGTNNLLHTTDGGHIWTAGNAPCADWVSFVSPQDGFAFCGFPRNPGPGVMSKSFLRTTDGGATWQTVGSVSEAQIPHREGLPLAGYGAGLSMRTATEGWIALTRGGFLHTTDGGTTWESQLSDRRARNLPTVDGGYLDYSMADAVQFLSATHGYAVLNGRYLMETTDGGTNWQLLLDAAKLPADS